MLTASKRLNYRLFTPADADELWLLDQDPAVMRYIANGEPSTRERIASRFIPRMNAYTNPARGWGLWRVADRHSNEYLGWILTRPENFFENNLSDTTIELGWRFFSASLG